MIRTSKAPVAWPVEWRPGVQYFFRAGDVIERAQFEGELAGEFGAASVYCMEKLAMFAEGVAALLADRPDYAAQLVEMDRADMALKQGERLPPEEAAAIVQARELVRQHYPPYRAVIVQEEQRHSVTPVAAFARYCTGWDDAEPGKVAEARGWLAAEAPDANDYPLLSAAAKSEKTEIADLAQTLVDEALPEFTLGPDGKVSVDLLTKLPPLELKAGGMFAYRLQYGRGGEVEKNFMRPLSSGKGRKTTPSTTRKGGGRSQAKSGSGTRSTSSRRGRSKP
jgi:hypothetical protein